ncbi:MAG: TonB-dependent receptor [Bacteroidales bacterium]|nr:TonB-dependent receptor [Bacteroidales bacterium]
MKFRILLVILFVGIRLSVSAQNDTIIKLSEVKITTPANPVLFDRSGRFIQVIGQHEIKSAPVNNLEGILSQFNGFDVRSRGPFGVQSDLSIRGGSFDQNVILLNGIPLDDPQTGHNALDFSLAPDNIKKIEAILGPSSRWFGPNAFSGGINIITQPDSTNKLDLHITGGQYGLFSGLLSGNYHWGKIKNLTSVRYSRDDGYQRDTDFKTAGLFHQSVYHYKHTLMQLQLSFQDKAYGAYGYYTAQYPDQFEHTRNLFSSFDVSTGHKIKWEGSVSWHRMYDRFELFRQGKNWYEKQGNWYVMGQDSAGYHTPFGFFPYTGPNFHRTDVFYGRGQMHFSSVLGKSAVSVSFKKDHIISNVLGTVTTDTLYSSGGAFYDHSAERSEINLNANQLYSKGAFSASAGFNLFYNNQFGMLFSPGVDLSYSLNARYRLFASANRAIRLPTFTDLYYQGPDHISNPDLKAEQVTGFETGVKYFSRRVGATFSVFDRLGVNMIDWVKATPQDQWKSENITRLNTFGLALAVEYRAPTSQKFLQSLIFNYTYLTSNKSASGFISLYALDYLKHDVGIIMTNRLANHVTASWRVKVQDRNGGYFDYQTGRVLPYETAVLLNAKLSYRWGKSQLFIQGDNLLNKRVHDIGSVLLPGIWMTGGVSYQLGP